MEEVGCNYWPPCVLVFLTKTLMGVVFKLHRLK